jgi:hypothetical protein
VKKSIISLLGVNSKWVVVQNPNVQLDPPDCKLLFYKNSSLEFCFSESVMLFGQEQGKALHIIEALFEKVAQMEKLENEIDRVYKWDEYEKLENRFKLPNQVIEFKVKE